MRIAQEDIEQVKASVSLAQLVEERLGPPAKMHGQTYAWKCPFHDDDTPSFHVYPETNTFNCFGCGENGDVVAWLQRTEKLDFTSAYNRLKTNARQQPSGSSVRKSAPRRSVIQGPDDKWQSAAQDFVEQCEKELWSGHGRKQREYLVGRGLTDETIRTAHLGYIQHGFSLNPGEWGFPSDMHMSSRYVGPGIVIPWYIDGKLWAINRRQQDAELRYVMMPGSTKGLYQVGAFDLSRPIVLVEGEIDALTVHQEVGDVVTPAATGGVSGAHGEQWRSLLSKAPSVLLCFDADSPGDSARDYWMSILPNAKPWRPFFGDVNAMHQAGVPIRRWVEVGLKARG